jgi:ribosomal protein S18 acetylase RimI-like enzyme
MATTTAVPTIVYSAKNHLSYATFHAKNFLTDPMFNYLLQLNTPWYHRSAATYHTIRLQFHAAGHKNRAIYISASAPSTTLLPANVELNPQCHAVVLPPGKTDLLDVGALGWMDLVFRRGLHKMFWYSGMKPWKVFWKHLLAPTESAKAATFAAKEDYYYIFFISTADEHRGKGLAHALISDLQARAQEEGKPIWLESSSQGSRKLYLRCGFLDVPVDDGEVGIAVGVGEVNERGEKCEGSAAVGVRLYPMVWWPEGHKKGNTEVV